MAKQPEPPPPPRRTITVIWDAGPRSWRAQSEDADKRPIAVEGGGSPSDAVGKLVEAYPAVFGIKVTIDMEETMKDEG